MATETLAHRDALVRATPQETYYTVGEAAELLRVSRVTIWRWIRAGYLPVARLGHRTTRIKQQDLQRLPVQIGAGQRSRPSQPAPQPDLAYANATDHFVQFYDSDAFLIGAIREFIGGALSAGNTGIVVASAEHRQEVDAALRADHPDLDVLAAAGRYVVLDAAETLARFMADGAPDPQRFREVIGNLIACGVRDGQRVRVYGEMVALLAAAGDHASTLRLEQLWNELQHTYSFSLLCGYAMDQFGGEGLAELLSDVCGEHSQVQPTESYTALVNLDDRLRAITVLQQKARSLQSEIAARKATEERLRLALEAEQAARREAEAALHVRDEFLSVASHELRTPISSLSAQAQLIQRRLQREGQIEPERVERAMQLFASQTDKLARLMNQLLDVTRLEAGKLTVEPEPTAVVPLVERAVTQAQELTDRHVINLRLDVAGPLEARVDPLRLEQVLTNLLDNAIKYSPDGGPIDVVLKQEPLAGAFEISVRDAGVGIPDEKRDQIFERFFQAHDGQRGGMGLGLYISRQIVELHGGAIRAESPPGGGTRMVVRLPLEAPACPTA